MEQKPDKRKYIIIVLSGLLLCSIVYIVVAQKNMPDFLSPDSNAVLFDGYRQTRTREIEQSGIAIPGLEYLYFRADQTSQAVNFFNPEVNDGILLKLSLLIDGKPYWTSGLIEAGKGYYQIELTDPLKAGTYQSYLCYDCFTLAGLQLNSAQLEFTLFVE